MCLTGLKEPTNCCFTLRVSKYTKSGELIARFYYYFCWGGGGGGLLVVVVVGFLCLFFCFVVVVVVTAVAPRETDATSAHVQRAPYNHAPVYSGIHSDMHLFGQPRILGSSVFRGRAGGTWRRNPFYTSDL